MGRDVSVVDGMSVEKMKTGLLKKSMVCFAPGVFHEGGGNVAKCWG